MYDKYYSKFTFTPEFNTSLTPAVFPAAIHELQKYSITQGCEVKTFPNHGDEPYPSRRAQY